MTPPPFVLELSTFVAVRNENVGDCIASNKLPLGYPNGSKNYTGLRETPLAALERAKMVDDGPVTKHTHVVALTLSPFHFFVALDERSWEIRERERGREKERKREREIRIS